MQKVHAALPEAVRQLTNKIRRTLAIALENHGLTLSLPEVQILVVIASEPDISPQAIASLTGYDKAVVTRKIKMLEDAKLVQRATHPEDQRRLTLKLTKTGATCCTKINAARQEAHAAVFHPLSSAEQKELSRLLKRCL